MYPHNAIFFNTFNFKINMSQFSFLNINYNPKNLKLI